MSKRLADDVSDEIEAMSDLFQAKLQYIRVDEASGGEEDEQEGF